jgi:hypothetical protein
LLFNFLILNYMKKILENIKWWLVFWFTALVVLVAWWLIYATLNFSDLKTVSEWDTLTAESWNKVVEAINALKEESNTNLNTLNSINTNLNTLSWTIASITTTLPSAPSANWQVSFGWRYYKVLSGTYNWVDAMTTCIGLWSGRKIPSILELYYMYLNKSFITSLGTSRYWGSDVWGNSDINYGALFSMSIGSWSYNDIITTTNGYVVCIHD